MNAIKEVLAALCIFGRNIKAFILKCLPIYGEFFDELPGVAEWGVFEWYALVFICVPLLIIMLIVQIVAIVFVILVYAIQLAVKIWRIILRHIKRGVILTQTKIQAYYLCRENLWRLFNDYHEDLKIHRYEKSYSLVSSNPFILRHNVWMCCYSVRKKSPVLFDDEHLEFISETVEDGISSMLANGDFEGVVYPCNYKFVVDEVKDGKNTVNIYVLFVEDENDIAYLNRKTAVDHDAQDAPDVMEDEDFGRGG